MRKPSKNLKQCVPTLPDQIERPAHYLHSEIEPIDVIEAWGLPFHLGNVVKYLARHEHKGAALDDLRKARWYLDRYISRMEAEESHRGRPA